MRKVTGAVAGTALRVPIGDSSIFAGAACQRKQSSTLLTDKGCVTQWKPSSCGKFVELDELHIDRDVFETLARWATDHGLSIENAIQFALCCFNDSNAEGDHVETALTNIYRVQDSRTPVQSWRLMPPPTVRAPGTAAQPSGLASSHSSPHRSRRTRPRSAVP
jgi:hypothetical protein